MLRTASTRTNPRSSRTVTGVRQERLLEGTPVLLRLPIVDYVARIMPAVQGVSEEQTSAAASSRSGDAMAGGVLEVSAVGSDSLPPEVAGNGPSRSAPAAAACTEFVAQSMDEGAEETRSWWEHWSSGVVLILLVLALLVVSLMAIKKPRPSGELLADKEIEDLVIPSLEPVVSGGGVKPGISQAEGSKFSTNVGSDPNPSPKTSVVESRLAVESAPAISQPAQAVPVSPTNGMAGLGLSSPSNAPSLVPGELDLMPAGASNGLDLSMGAGQSSGAGRTANSPPVVERDKSALSLDVDIALSGSGLTSLAPTAAGRLPANPAPSTATLSAPIGIEQPRLFDPSELQFTEPLPVSPVSSPGVTPGYRQGPNLQDGAMGLSLEPDNGLTSAAVRPPMDQGISPSALGNSGQPARLVGATMGTLGERQQVVPETAITSPNVSRTAFPDLPADEIIRAWQTSKALNEAQNSTGNRYTPPTGSGTGTGAGSIAPTQPATTLPLPAAGQSGFGAFPPHPALPN
jgi:hypothetical protein